MCSSLPWSATFPGRPGHKRIGQHVEYYKVTQGATPRWALPDMIARSKLDTYAWQDEFRLVFSLTDALAFEKVNLRLVQMPATRSSDTAEHHHHDVQLDSLRDIAILHKFSVSLSA